MKKISKKIELSCKALGAAMFMGTVCLYMALGALFVFVSDAGFYYNISFAFLIQGILVSMIASAVWVLCFSSVKARGFFARYVPAFIGLAALFAASMLIPAIRGTEGYVLWIASGFLSTFAFGTAVAVSGNRYFKKTGTRSALLWEIS